ncbi:serine/threonine-protein kinase [Lentisphaera profundi]|uniref:Serine/threonine-protein kinase n=1 Tax=Lentisphaera profundi TaxID=1658616 RepID=A0ABY7VXK0_9BACT|nr:serine/threonine-protein kinase [Lentisphaera profundi]WDE96793.1 serine/threonine-protein kinase [Lentisphaera profundi]
MKVQCENCFGVNAVDETDLGEYLQCGHCAEAFLVPAERFAPGVVIDDYIIEKKIGQGGMGVVFRALQISLDRYVALKILALRTQSQDAVIDFVREARASAKLQHQNIVQAYAVGQADGGVYYLAMELVNGQTLKEILDVEKKISVEAALNITKQVSDALAYAWAQQKLVHRDIKPDNIMVVDDMAKLMDLGLSRFANDKLESTDDGDSIMGTPQYISPEQLIGAEMDFRADIYSLGATLYHFVTGEFAFGGTSVTEIARKHLQEPLRPAHELNSLVPPQVSKLLERMMEKQPEDRFQSMQDLSREIDKTRKAISTNTTSTKKGLHLRSNSSRRRNVEGGGRVAHRPVAGETRARARAGAIELSPEEIKSYTDTAGHGKLKALSAACLAGTIVVSLVLLLI